MNDQKVFSKERIKYLNLLSNSYPNANSICTEIINLQAILNLPKGTEHFMSDLHGEYEAFYHILNNCSGVIKEKVRMIYGSTLTPQACSELCTLIYYPKEKLQMAAKDGTADNEWYKNTINRLIELCKVLSSKYTRSKVRKALPPEYGYIIDELLHAQPDEDNNQLLYHEKILETLINVNNGDEFICALSALIKRLAVDRLHIVGDIFDRGPRPDSIMDMLISHHAVDIQWGNHDVLWMGAACGNKTCIAAVVRNSVAYDNMAVLENGYGISLRQLVLLSQKLYPDLSEQKTAYTAISAIMFKLEAQLITRSPQLNMDSRLMLNKINFDEASINIDGKNYSVDLSKLVSVNPQAPFELTAEESDVVAGLSADFAQSHRLKRHVEFLYSKGSIYKCINNNLLFHGCVPFDDNWIFKEVHFNGSAYSGKAYMDFADRCAREAYFDGDPFSVDFMWYLWCGEYSPLCGRRTKTFERMYCSDKTLWEEPGNNYYKLCNNESTCNIILKEFNLEGDCHIINGHTPIKVLKGESPLKGNGKLIVIDGGFCRAYQKTTGIAGYTLIFNSHGLRIMSHKPFNGIQATLNENKDIHSHSEIFHTNEKRVMVADSDNGKVIKEQINDLQDLLFAYRSGIMSADNSH